MARILLLTVDCDLPGHPVNGGVLRVRQLSRHLRRIGHDVVVSMPVEGLAHDPGGDDHPEAAHPADDPSEIVERLRPDVVVCEQWHLASLLRPLSCPLWLDLHGSLLAENAFRWAGGVDSPQRYDHDVIAKLFAFEKADLVTCAGMRQRLYFRGWHAIGGSTWDECEVVHLPLSIPPSRSVPRPRHDQGLRYLYAGNLWPWIDLSGWLPEFLNALAERPDDEVHFYVDDPLGRRDCVQVIARAGSGPGLERLRAEGRIRISGRLAHSQFRRQARRYDIALDLFGWNSERELAVTTRTLEFLALGLPVLYPSHAELAELISRSACGWLVDVSRPGAVATEVLAVDEEAVRSRETAARALSALRELEALSLKRCGEAISAVLAGPRKSQQRGVAQRLRTLDRKSGHDELVRLRRELEAGEEKLSALRAELAGREAAAAELVQQLEKERAGREHRIGMLEQELREKDLHAGKIEAGSADLRRELERVQQEGLKLRREAQEREDQTRRELVRLERAQQEGLKLRREAQEREDQTRRERVRLECERAAERQAHHDQLARLESVVAARQMAGLVAAARPRRFRRGLRLRAKLAWLHLDYLLIRCYLGIWQRLCKRRIFPGM
ncbi:MAG: hypothetical protein GY835_23340 [bacterium]|nr:hypothetical protein [bacterium]